MTFDLDLGTAFTIVGALAAVWWGLVRLMFAQFEKRQDERFEALNKTLSEQKTELDGHMTKQDGLLAELRRVEVSTMTEIRRVEGELTRCQVDALQRYQTKHEASNQHGEILNAIRALSARIDLMHGMVNGKGGE